MHDATSPQKSDVPGHDASQDPPSAVTPSPRAFDNDNTSMEQATEGYFAFRETGPQSPGSMHEAGSLGMLPGGAGAALTALQYLPVPVLVLSAEKTVQLGNDAMGRLLGINPLTVSTESGVPLSVSEILRDQHINQLGIDILQGGSPIWMKWEVSCDEFSPSVPSKQREKKAN